MLWFFPLPTARWRCITSLELQTCQAFWAASDPAKRPRRRRRLPSSRTATGRPEDRARAAGLAVLGRRGLLELADLTFEVGEVFEALVHRRESQVCHGIERPQAFQHG